MEGDKTKQSKATEGLYARLQSAVPAERQCLMTQQRPSQSWCRTKRAHPSLSGLAKAHNMVWSYVIIPSRCNYTAALKVLIRPLLCVVPHMASGAFVLSGGLPGALQRALQWALQCVSTGRFLQRNTNSAGDPTTFSLLLLSFYINFATPSLLCAFAASSPRSTSGPPTTHTHTNKHFSLCPHCVRHTTVWKELYQHSELR